jgi:MFS family permease
VWNFYSDRLGRVALLVTTLFLTYLGGIVMFILHAQLLGELGPSILPVEHWALDSTLGFIGLMPAVALILPLIARYASAPHRPAYNVSGRLQTARYALIGGALFALATAPGPIIHDLLVGRGTFLANHVTTVLNPGAPAMASMEMSDISPVLSIGSQILVGFPTYALLMWASLIAVRALVRARRRLQVAQSALAVPELAVAEPADGFVDG